MAFYEMSSDRLHEVPETTFADARIGERADLQRLLRVQIGIVAEDTLVIAEEFGEWEDSKRRIDLLGLDKNANLVVFELKRTEDGGHMELQALRYAAMVSTMTFEKAEEMYAGYLRRLGQETDARSAILEFLKWTDGEENPFAQDVRIVLVSAEFSKELTTSVMWLNKQGLDIRCVRIKPYAHNGSVLIEVQRIIPLPEADDYTIRIKEKEVRDKVVRERSKADRPSVVKWNDEAESRQVSTWREALVEGTKKALKLGLARDDLPMNHSDDIEAVKTFHSALQVESNLHIETNASAELIRQWLSRMLEKLGKPNGFLQIATKAGKTYDLPEVVK
ncbi:MAG: hypothetical protein WED34_00065 [Planctomycetales bacterium]